MAGRKRKAPPRARQPPERKGALRKLESAGAQKAGKARVAKAAPPKPRVRKAPLDEAPVDHEAAGKRPEKTPAKSSADAAASKSAIEPVASAPRRDFMVVGLGASAGGLEALKQFFSGVSAAMGMAFVVVTHQQSGSVTLLPQLLSKETKLPIVLIENGVTLEPGVVYVATSAPVSVRDGRLWLDEPDKSVPHHPIDFFFRSLAADCRDRSVAIVLSGTGSDGALGLSEIKSAGGVIFAQDSDSARYSGMPASATATRLVDYNMPPSEMPAKLVELAERAGKMEPEGEEVTAALYRVLHLLRARTGTDFTAYKKSTLWRRIERRMNVRAVENASAYARLLQETPDEVERLFRELLISVTSFFRDLETFAVLSVELRNLFDSWPDGRPFRAWVPACATGEEAYSLAIIVREVLADLRKNVPVQIFATDLDPMAIDTARIGRYPSGISANVNGQRLETFFVKEEGSYRVCKEIRETIVFAVQNVIKDPPFTRLDLLSCRNLLIYLEAELQRRVIGLFSYALRPKGLLLLGSSESIAGFNEAFENVDKKNKLFRRRDTRAETPSEFSAVPATVNVSRPPDAKASADGESVAVVQSAEQVLLANLAPPSVLINERGEIAYFHGRTGRFLEPPAGEPVSNLFSMLRKGLRLEVPAAMRQAARRSEPIVHSGLQVASDNGFISVRLTVRHLSDPPPVRDMYLVTFEIEPALSAKRKATVRADSQPSQRISELELELQHTRENLQGTIEELETSNEELKSTNEELQSTNEELQSANEELETSREEMQSLNEELQTVNSELEERNRALSQANDDMQNLLNSTDVATVFLDDNLAIKRFTTQARKVFSLIDTDIGRPISDLSANLEYDGFVRDARDVLHSLVFQEREIRTKEGAWRLMRIMPYRTAENVIDGLVMTFIDIDRVKAKEEETEAARRLAETMVEAVPAGVMVVDAELRVVSANRTFLELFRTTVKRTVGESVQSLADGALDSPEFLTPIAEVFKTGEEMHERPLRAIGQRVIQQPLLMSARRMLTKPGEAQRVLVMVRTLSDAES
jgi:two-component system CheB/CheR fusion protein